MSKQQLCYERVSMSVIMFNAKDIITTSGYDQAPDGPIVTPDDEIF